MTSDGRFTESRFFSPIFNSAIFDGPIRIYFAQPQEPLALGLHFEIHEKNRKLLERAKSCARVWDAMICIMLYPDTEMFEKSFTAKNQKEMFIATEAIGEDHIIGIRVEHGQQTFSGIVSLIEDIIEHWEDKVVNDVSAVRVF